MADELIGLNLVATPSLVAHFETAADASDAIRLVGSLLVREGAATGEHVEAAIRREEDYPTGLPAEVPFALVHTDAPGATKLAAALGVFNRPVAFRQMDDSAHLLSVRLVVFLTVPARHQQAEVLSWLIGRLANKEIAERLLTAAPGEAVRLLNGRSDAEKAA